MGTLATKTVNDQLVHYDSAYGWRWLDAFGPAVVKREVKPPIALQATSSLAAYKTTLVNASTIADAPDIAGGAFIITSAAAEHDGVNLHGIDEPFLFSSKWPAYFGVKLQTNDADQSVLWAGIGLADDNWDTGAPNDYIAFYSADEAATVDFRVAKDGSATALESVATLVDSTEITLEWYFDGETVYAYVNGVLAGSIAASNVNMPDDDYMTLSLDFTTGEGNAATCTVKWIRCIQIQQE